MAPILQDHPATTGLVFGGPYEPHRRGGRWIIEHGGDSMALGFINTGHTEPVGERCNDNFSYWRLVFSGPLPTDVDTYVRVRFEIESLGRAWTWRRSTLIRRTATVDLRVCDLRETQTVPHGDDYEARLIPIKQLNCFVILPGFFRTARLSPATRYVRLLEGRRWERYLGRATGLFGASKLVITYWRPDYEVSPQKEFRAFLDLRREGWTDRLATFSLALTAVLDGTALMSNPHDLAKAPLVKAAEALWEVSGIRVSLGISAVAIALSLLRAIAASRTRWRQARRWLRAAEQRIYRLPARLD